MTNDAEFRSPIHEGLTLYRSNWKVQWLIYGITFVVAVTLAVTLETQFNLPASAVVSFLFVLIVALALMVPAGLIILQRPVQRNRQSLPKMYLESLELLRALDATAYASIDIRTLAAHLSAYVDDLDINLVTRRLRRHEGETVLPKIETVISNDEWQLIWYRWAEQMDLEEIARVTGRPKDEIAYQISKATAKTRYWVKALRSEHNISDEDKTIALSSKLGPPRRVRKKEIVNLDINEYVAASRNPYQLT